MKNGLQNLFYFFVGEFFLFTKLFIWNFFDPSNIKELDAELKAARGELLASIEKGKNFCINDHFLN